MFICQNLNVLISGVIAISFFRIHDCRRKINKIFSILFKFDQTVASIQIFFLKTVFQWCERNYNTKAYFEFIDNKRASSILFIHKTIITISFIISLFSYAITHTLIYTFLSNAFFILYFLINLDIFNHIAAEKCLIINHNLKILKTVIS